jgi:hypothetical protein
MSVVRTLAFGLNKISPPQSPAENGILMPFLKCFNYLSIGHSIELG